MSYTKGKWYLDYDVITTKPHREGNVIASVKMVGITSETKANARLLAAAPQLLEACKRYVRMQDEINAEMDKKPTGTMYWMFKDAIEAAES